jgi:hypothetical protein
MKVSLDAWSSPPYHPSCQSLRKTLCEIHIVRITFIEAEQTVINAGLEKMNFFEARIMNVT